jgi:hypothetical protein
MEYVIEGTWEEIKSREAELAGHYLTVIVDPPEPPNTYHNLQELEALLEGGFRGEPHRVTDESWDEIKQEVRRRLAPRQAAAAEENRP